MHAHPLHLEGSIADRLSNTPIPTALIEAHDADQKFPDLLAATLSDKSGKFTLTFDPALLQKAFDNRPPKISLTTTIKGTRVAHSAADQPVLLTPSTKPLALTIKLPDPYAGDNLFQHLPPTLRAEIDALKQHEPAVLEKLKDEKLKQAFLQNPAQALAAMGIPISPQLRQRLAADPAPQNLLTPRSFRLLNGQTVTPKIKINFTSGKGINHGR